MVPGSFNKNENVKIIVITEGIGRSYLEKRKTELNLNNIILLDFICENIYFPNLIGILKNSF